jgi:anti-sigma factor RsiW
MTDSWTDRLSEYVDGDLDAETRQALDAHLATCASCRATRDALGRVAARARTLGYRPPAGDLWPGVERAIVAPPIAPLVAARRRYVTLSLGRLVAAAAIVAAVAGGVAWSIASRQSERDVPIAIAPASPAGDTGAGLPPSPAALAVASYRDAAADLERVLEAGRGSLRPETMRVIEANLRSIDVAIAQADSALRQDPGSDYLNQYLAATMQRKLKLLRQAVAITSART